MTETTAMDSYQRALELLQSGNPQAAIPHFETAINQSPGNPEWLKNLGNAWRSVGQADQAERRYRDALAIDPEYMPAHNNIALVFRSKGQLTEAEVHFRHALRLAPGDSDILTNLGVVLIEQQQLVEARELIDRALRINEHDIFAWQSLAAIQRQQGQLQQALISLDRALSLAPTMLELLLEKSDICDALRELKLQSQTLEQARLINPEDSRVAIRLGMLALNEARYNDAIPLLQAAQQNPELAALAHYGLGKAHYELGDAQQAQYELEQATQLNPKALEALGLLLMVHLHACNWRGLPTLIERVRTLVAAEKGTRFPPFVFLATGASLEEILDCAQKYSANVIKPLVNAVSTQLTPKLYQDHNKIRLGYISGDFREHPLARLVAEMFELHDRDRFDVYAYCYSQDDQSAIRTRLIQGVDSFCSIKALSPGAAAQRIQQDEIDILIDLTGYTGDSRTEILALRPAAIQVSYLGYLATSGSHFIDYIVADAQAIPESADRWFSEKVVRLPFYQVSDRHRTMGAPASRQALGLPDDAVVYCCFNQPYKITPDVFSRWMNILRAVPKAVLWLYAFNPLTRENLTAAAQAQGIDSSRVIFAQRVSMDDYLARMRIADLFLDTSPYNGGATASDALWAGLPVLTCPGTSFASRMCASLVKAAGSPELIADSPEAYEQLAIALGQAPLRLKRIARRLETQRQHMTLFDCPKTLADLEQAYEKMRQIAHRGDAPQTIEIES